MTTTPTLVTLPAGAPVRIESPYPPVYGGLRSPAPQGRWATIDYLQDGEWRRTEGRAYLLTDPCAAQPRGYGTAWCTLPSGHAGSHDTTNTIPEA